MPLPKDIDQRYLQYLRLELGLSPNSCASYLDDMHKLLSWMDVICLEPHELSYERLQSFVASLYDLGISPRSVARIISGIKSFCRFLRLEEYIDTDPTELLDSPRIGQHLPSVLSTKEVDGLLQAIEDKGGAEMMRNRAIVEVLFSCGLRVSELCQLKHSDLFLDEEYLRVTGKGRKQRLIPMSGSAIRDITEYIQHARVLPQRGQEEFVFLSRRGRAISRNMVFMVIQEAARLSGIDRPISPHTLRHSFATALLEGGANLQAIQLMMGHEDISATQIYTHIDRRKLREQIEMYHPRNQKKD